MPTTKVLFVDDDEQVRESFEFAHSPYFNIVLADGGKQALGILGKDSNIGVAVVDIRMPKMDGIELAQIIRESWPDIKIIIHTANMSISSVVKSINLAQVDGFLEKVAHDEDALDKVRTVISLRLREYEHRG
jgi:DNA-binding NtrC family response regulator